MASAAAALRALLLCALLSAGGAVPRAPALGPAAAHRALARAAGRSGAAARAGGVRAHPSASEAQLASCAVRHFDTQLDHFSWATSATFPLRYFICDAYWRRGPDGQAGPIFFYTGNEADVTLYVNHTGLMWETAPEAGALLVFAEHRYYGESTPTFSNDATSDATSDAALTSEQMAYLTSEQALADFAALIFDLRSRLDAPEAPVIAFGGSYGGMLATWLRIHYPSAVDGAVAGSAPIWMFPGQDPPADTGGFAEVVTRDASEATGAPPACVDNLRAAWAALFDAAQAPDGPAQLTQLFNLCSESALTSSEDALGLAFWLQSAFDYLSMGDFPYASDYLTNGGGVLPPWPMRAACEPLADASLPARPRELLAALRDAAAVFYNVSGDVACFNSNANVNEATAKDDEFWWYQACTEMVMPQSRDGVRDAFWPQPYDSDAAAAGCAQRWGVQPRATWAAVSYGARRLRAASNILFSNGGLDPWRAGGVTRTLSRTLLAVDIPLGAHHLDLMFAHPDDPECVREARDVERREIARWVREAYRGGPPGGGGGSDGWAARHGAALAVAAALGACASAVVAAAALLCQRPRRRCAAAAQRAAAAAAQQRWRSPGSDADSVDAAHSFVPPEGHPNAEARWDPHAPLLAEGYGGSYGEEA